MELQINKFKEPAFGELTTIKSPTGKIMFLAKEAGKMWGHSNITQACKRLLDNTEMLLVKKKENKQFFSTLHLNNVLTSNIQQAIFITESGLYKLALASNLEKAVPFRDWVTKEVLPSIREKGFYNLRLSAKEIADQTNRDVQLQNSKTINSKNYEKNGVAEIIKYNQDNCKQVTGMLPNQIKKIAGKKISAKEILRETNPELAAAMSLNDHLVVNGIATLKELQALDKAMIPAFKELSKLGILIDK